MKNTAEQVILIEDNINRWLLTEADGTWHMETEKPGQIIVLEKYHNLASDESVMYSLENIRTMAAERNAAGKIASLCYPDEGFNTNPDFTAFMALYRSKRAAETALLESLDHFLAASQDSGDVNELTRALEEVL